MPRQHSFSFIFPLFSSFSIASLVSLISHFSRYHYPLVCSAIFSLPLASHLIAPASLDIHSEGKTTAKCHLPASPSLLTAHSASASRGSYKYQTPQQSFKLAVSRFTKLLRRLARGFRSHSAENTSISTLAIISTSAISISNNNPYPSRSQAQVQGHCGQSAPPTAIERAMAITSIRPATGSRSRRSADNTIGLRYEKTVQAEPPIPLPPRSTSRNTIRTLSIRSSASSPSPSLYSVSLYSPSLVVVTPPQLALLPITPPTEQHPALRTPVRQTKLAHESWKRDSGLAPTPTSANTIYEEDCEEEEAKQDSKQLADAQVSVSDKPTKVDEVPRHRVPQVQAQAQHGTAVGPVAAGWQCSTSETKFHQPAASASFPCLENPNTAVAPSRAQPQPPSPPRSLSSPVSPKRQSILKRLSVCSSASAKGKLALQALAIDEGSAAANAPMQPLMRGSQQASTHKQPQRSTAEQSPLPLLQIQTLSRDTASPGDVNDRFAPLGISIPTHSLLEDDFMATLSFSNRGSIMFGGRRAGALGLDGANDSRGDVSAPSTPTHNHARSSSTSVDRIESLAASASNPNLVPRAQPPPDIRLLASDVDKESQKVRSLYGVGDAINWEDGARRSYCEPLEPTPELPAEEDGTDSYGLP